MVLTDTEAKDRQFLALGYYRGLTILRSDREACWMVFAGDRAELLGRIQDSMSLREACAALASMGDEMGGLYALADEPRFAKPARED